MLAYYKTTARFYKAKDTVAFNSFLLNEVQQNMENPRSIAVAMDYIRINQNSRPKLLKLKALLAGQKTDFSWFLLYKLGVGRMNSILAVKPINLDDYSFLNRENKVAKLNLSSDDYYSLDFWFVGCVPCMQQHKLIKANYLKLQQNKIGIIGIFVDEKTTPWNKYLDKNGYTWPNYLQTPGHKLTDYLSIDGFPTYFVIDNMGNVIGTYGGLDEVLAS